jgi:hypothetical protein
MSSVCPTSSGREGPPSPLPSRFRAQERRDAAGPGDDLQDLADELLFQPGQDLRDRGGQVGLPGSLADQPGGDWHIVWGSSRAAGARPADGAGSS